MSNDTQTSRLRVVIAGAGVAALEGLAALHAYAPGLTDVTIVSPAEHFATRALAVREPFDYPRAEGYPVAAVAEIAGAQVVGERMASVDTDRKVVVTASGDELPYDALLVATGARAAVRYEHAITIDDRTVDRHLQELLSGIASGGVHSVAFVAPPEMAWPLPLYELALMTKQYAWTQDRQLTTTLITSEDEPLHLFGNLGSRNLMRLLKAAEIDVHTSSFAEVPSEGRVVLFPGERMVAVDRVVSLPELLGPRIQGLPSDDGGFVPIDDHAAVLDVAGVFAAGDATNTPVKHGGLGAQMADAAARQIAKLAGADVPTDPIETTIRAQLLTGTAPVYLQARREGGYSYDAQFSLEPLWEPAEKVPTRFLGPLLRSMALEPVDLAA